MHLTYWWSALILMCGWQSSIIRSSNKVNKSLVPIWIVVRRKVSTTLFQLQEPNNGVMRSYCYTMTSDVNKFEPPTNYLAVPCNSNAKYFCTKKVPGKSMAMQKNYNTVSSCYVFNLEYAPSSADNTIQLSDVQYHTSRFSTCYIPRVNHFR